MNRLAGIVLLILCLTGACCACAESAGADWADMYALSVENAIEYGDLREEWAKEPDVYKPAPQGAEILLLPKDAVLSGDIALESGSTGNHVGLGNIAGRLKLIYHGQAGITVEKDEMKRTVARITIPQNRPKERRA